MAVTKPFRIIYIVGYGRSGSTLLDHMLSRKAGVFGAGELTNLFDEKLQDGQCSCGEKISLCAFWSRVFPGEHDPASNSRHSAITHAAERYLMPARRQAYYSVWKGILNSLFLNPEIEFLVDSSKSSRATYRRPVLLRDMGCEVYLIHLVRKPVGVIGSLAKGSNKALEAGRAGSARLFWLRGAIGWFIANYLADRLARKYAMRKLVVNYEGLLVDPQAELQEIAELTGADRLTDADDEHFVDHGISGNRMRRQTKKPEIRRSDSINGQMTHLQKLMVNWMNHWGRSRGYWAANPELTGPSKD